VVKRRPGNWASEKETHRSGRERAIRVTPKQWVGISPRKRKI
jgi:hypothetical protein